MRSIVYYRKAIQFPFFVVLLIVEIHCRNFSRMMREMKQVTELNDMEKYEYIELDESLIRSIQYIVSGEDYYCVSISGDKTLFHEKIVVAAHHFFQALVVSQGPNPLRCNATFVAVEDTEGLWRTISSLPFRKSSRYYFMVRNSTLDILERMFRDNTTVFKEAEVAIAVYKHEKQVLQFNPPIPGIKLMDVPASGHWERTVVNMKGDEIRFTTGNCDMHSKLSHNGTHYNFGGVEWKIFEAITRRMGLKRKFIHSTNLTYLGDYNGTWTGGLLGKIANEEADVGFCSLWIESRKLGSGIQMTVPYNQVCITYIVPRPKAEYHATHGGFSELSAYSMVFTSSYSGQLVSIWTSVSYAPIPKNVKDLVESDYSNPYLGSPPYPWSGILNQNDPYAEKWIARSEPVNEFSDLVQRLRSKPKQSYIGSVYKHEIFIPMTPSQIPFDVLADYEVMDSCIGEVFQGFAFQEGSRFLKGFNWYLDYFKQYGFITKEYREAFSEVSNKNSAYWDIMIKSGTLRHLIPLSLGHLSLIFKYMLIGHTLAMLVFMGEIYYHHIPLERGFHQQNP